jgi:hypothetical protein
MTIYSGPVVGMAGGAENVGAPGTTRALWP